MSEIQAGIYKGRGVPDSVQTGATSGGHDQIAINLDVPELGRELTTFLVFSDAAAKFALERLRALGWDGSVNTDGTPNCATCNRNEVDVRVKYEPFNGEEKMKVEILTAGGGVQIKQFDDKAKRAFGTRFKALLKQNGVVPSARQEIASEAASDDIPF